MVVQESRFHLGVLRSSTMSGDGPSGVGPSAGRWSFPEREGRIGRVARGVWGARSSVFVGPTDHTWSPEEGGVAISRIGLDLEDGRGPWCGVWGGRI